MQKNSGYNRQRIPDNGFCRKKRRGFSRKLFIAILVLVICFVSAGVTVAYLTSQPDRAENTFIPGKVPCEVEETFNNTEKKDVSIRNTGNIDAYIRAKVVVTWMSEDGTEVSAQTPVEDTDCVIEYASEASGWKLSSDGFWYFTSEVAPNALTADLIESCKLKDGVTPPEGYYLSVEIVAGSIEAKPSKAVVESWNSGVSSAIDGTLNIIQ